MSNKRNLFIGLDLGGTFLKYALGTADGELLIKDKKPSKADESQDEIFNVIFETISELKEKAAEFDGQVAAIGLGSPGAVHFEECRLIGSTPNIEKWTDAPIRKRVESQFEIPIWADNDANVMAFGEARQGAAKGRKNVLCATLGTGIGGGILIDGELYRGTHYAGSEIGHVMIVHNGRKCNCGGLGCFEQYASAPAMVRNYKEKMQELGKTLPADIGTEFIFKQAEKDEIEAQQTIDETCDYLGTGFASLVNVFNPEMLVLGGGVAEAGEHFIEKIRKAIQEKAMNPALRGFEVAHAQLKNDAGVIGAISMAFEEYEKAK